MTQSTAYNPVRELYDAHCSRHFPALGVMLGNLVLYDAWIAGYASRAANGERISPDKLPEPDHETVETIARLRASADLTANELELLKYFEGLEQLRNAIATG